MKTGTRWVRRMGNLLGGTSGIALLIGLAASAGATIRNVPADYTNIQEAVNAAADGDTVLVSNGLYRLTAGIQLTKPISVRSVNGPQVTTIDGQGQTRCVYIDHANAVLDGFTVKGGYNPGGFGGGVDINTGGTVQNCVLSGNQARDGGGIALDYGGLALNCVISNNLASDNSGNGYGGGVRCLNGGTVRGCLVLNNESVALGGGVNIWEVGRVENCTIVSNKAPNGAGIRTRNLGSVVNSIIYFSIGTDWALDGSGYSYSNCCTPSAGSLPGSGNIDSDPQFADPLTDDYRLLADSPCINAGLYLPWMVAAFDLDGNTRVQDSSVDMGAYENDPSITGRPDFCIASIRFAPFPLTPGCSFIAYVTVTNSGTAAGNARNLEIWVDRYAWATNSNGDQGLSVGRIAPGASKELIFTGLTAPTRADGTYHFRAFVDSDNGIAELDEDNNQQTVPYLFASTLFKDKADFAITGATGTVEPWAPAPVGLIYGSITIANTGTAGGDAGRLTYWSDWDWSFLTLTKQPFGDLGGNVGWLNPGESRTYNIDGLMPAATYGTHTLLFFVDSNQATDEYSEWNNILPFTYEFTGNPSNYKEKPDFAITNIVLEPLNPGPGEVFDAYIYVVNSGSAAGNPGNLSLWISRSEWASNSVGADVTAPVAGLAAGESRTLHFAGLTAPALSNGRTHHFRALIDSDNGTAEPSEGNNQLSSFYYFGYPSYGDKPDLCIIDMSVSPSPLTPNCAFTTTVTIANSGPVANGSGCNLAIWADHAAAASNEIGAVVATIGPLNPGEVTTVSVTGLTTPSTGWNHTLRAFVDSSALIEEQSEGNNQLSIFYEYPH